MKKLRKWSDTDPFLYDITISDGKDILKDKIGFRTITTKGHEILLNGKPLLLKGICIHEESPTGKNRANSPEDATQLLNWAKDLGCNYVRLAHYPHNEYMIRMAEKMGILVWEEIPVYWAASVGKTKALT
ncbi:glycoside hydrolase family 2 TIM barrel-domain containing protein [Flavobacterium sp. 3HN19-14]|uniref:glycoside hydrolase family 2 TIM barrel-domain containing protein n=1 Tax=Flavobacterium sp. 3HN19-14 TaxID=3448133 RepID=UPI003EDF1798